jgi:putative NADH-flavin reductase
MMQIVVLGATGRIGAEVVAEGLRRDWTVRAATRGGARLPVLPRLSTMRVDFADPERLGALLSDVDAVIACLGPRPRTTADAAEFVAACLRLVAALDRHHVRRLVVVSEAEVRLPGEPPLGVAPRLGLRLRRVRQRLVAKQVEYEVIAASGLDWTVLRPVAVRDGGRTGDYELGPSARDTRPGISPADVAVALVDQVSDSHHLREAPFVWRAPTGR